MVWNRLRYVKNPDTGKRVSRLNPSAEWITEGRPDAAHHQRRVVERRERATERNEARGRETTRQSGSARTPAVPVLGADEVRRVRLGFHHGQRNRLSCFGARDKGTCDNGLTIRRDEVEARVLRALQEKLLRSGICSKSSAMNSRAR